MLDEAKVEILSIWQDIKNAFENNEFPATKNALCKDWCYYKPICPLFNKEAPSTDKLREIVEKIAEINETLDALEMFENHMLAFANTCASHVHLYKYLQFMCVANKLEL